MPRRRDAPQKHLHDAVQQGKVTEQDVDRAISRTLTHFIALGELDGPKSVVYQVLHFTALQHATQYCVLHCSTIVALQTKRTRN